MSSEIIICFLSVCVFVFSFLQKKRIKMLPTWTCERVYPVIRRGRFTSMPFVFYKWEEESITTRYPICSLLLNFLTNCYIAVLTILRMSLRS